MPSSLKKPISTAAIAGKYELETRSGITTFIDGLLAIRKRHPLSVSCCGTLPTALLRASATHDGNASRSTKPPHLLRRRLRHLLKMRRREFRKTNLHPATARSDKCA